MKQYIKPELYYESFEMSQHVASCYFDLNSAQGSCPFVSDKVVNTTDPDAKQVGLPGIVIFKSDIEDCIEDYQNYQHYCYTTGTLNDLTFNS